MARKRDEDEDDSAALSHNPFAGLASMRDQLPVGTPPKPERAPRHPARAVVRLERKGHGGKEVTVISHLELKPKTLEAWLKSLKSELGCGGAIDDDMIYLQGDQRERLRAALTARGVKNVTVS